MWRIGTYERVSNSSVFYSSSYRLLASRSCSTIEYLIVVPRSVTWIRILIVCVRSESRRLIVDVLLVVQCSMKRVRHVSDQRSSGLLGKRRNSRKRIPCFCKNSARCDTVYYKIKTRVLKNKADKSTRNNNEERKKMLNYVVTKHTE